MNEFYWLQVSSEINNAPGIFHTKDNESIVTVSSCWSSSLSEVQGIITSFNFKGPE